MLDRLERRCSAWATGKAIFIAFIFYALLALALNRASGMLEPRASGAQVPDLHFAVREAEVHRIFEMYGPEGRRIYFFAILIVDTLYPIAYTSLFGFLIAFVGRRVQSPQSPWRYLCLLPLCAMLVDYLENVGLLIQCHTFPERWPALGMSTLVFNSLKWIFIGLCALVFLIHMLILASRRLSVRETQ